MRIILTKPSVREFRLDEIEKENIIENLTKS